MQDESAEIKKALNKLTKNAAIDGDEFKLLKKSGNIKTWDWIGSLKDEKNLSGKVQFKNKGQQVLQTYKDGLLKEISVSDPSGKALKKVTYGRTTHFGPEDLYKIQNRVIKNADGSKVVKSIGNIEWGGNYKYFKAVDGIVSPKLYTDSKCKIPYTGEDAAKLIKCLKENMAKYNIINCM